MNRELEDKSKGLIEIQLVSHGSGQRVALSVFGADESVRVAAATQHSFTVRQG